MFETWGWSQEKSKKCDGRTTDEAPQADSHKKLRKLMNGEALVMFEKSLEKQRELEHQLVMVKTQRGRQASSRDEAVREA